MNVCTISRFVFAAASMATTAGAYAVQKSDQITVLGFTVSVPHIASRGECKANMLREDGETACFNNDEALDAFMNALGWGTFVVTDIQKTKETFGLRGA